MRKEVTTLSAFALAFSLVAYAAPACESSRESQPTPTREIPSPTASLEDFPFYSPPATISPRETPPPGWQEYVSLKRFDRIFFRFQLPQDWSVTKDQELEVIAESKPTRDLTQMARILILTRRSPYGSNTFAESIADERSVEDKSEQSSLEFQFKGEKVLSFVKRNQTAGIEEHIFGFTVDGVGVTIIIDAPSNRIRDEKGKFQYFFDKFEAITTGRR